MRLIWRRMRMRQNDRKRGPNELGRAHASHGSGGGYRRRWLAAPCWKLLFLVVVLAAPLVVFGTAGIRDFPMGIMPEIGAPMVRAHTEALGVSPAEVGQVVTAPLEQDLLNSVGFLHRINSVYGPGVSCVDLGFEPGTDLFVARQLVQERLTHAHAQPNVSTPPQMIQPVSSTRRMMMIGMTW